MNMLSLVAARARECHLSVSGANACWRQAGRRRDPGSCGVVVGLLNLAALPQQRHRHPQNLPPPASSTRPDAFRPPCLTGFRRSTRLRRLAMQMPRHAPCSARQDLSGAGRVRWRSSGWPARTNSPDPWERDAAGPILAALGNAQFLAGEPAKAARRWSARSPWVARARSGSCRAQRERSGPAGGRGGDHTRAAAFTGKPWQPLKPAATARSRPPLPSISLAFAGAGR